jgi:hypothetical protein
LTGKGWGTGWTQATAWRWVRRRVAIQERRMRRALGGRRSLGKEPRMG